MTISKTQRASIPRAGCQTAQGCTWWRSQVTRGLIAPSPVQIRSTYNAVFREPDGHGGVGSHNLPSESMTGRDRPSSPGLRNTFPGDEACGAQRDSVSRFKAVTGRESALCLGSCGVRLPTIPNSARRSPMLRRVHTARYGKQR